MKLRISFSQLILLSSLIILSISKSKKKKTKKEKNTTKLPNGLPTPDSVRPSYIIPELFCETCRAIINEALKELRTKTKESDIYNYLSEACVEDRYLTYEYIPKDIQRTCGIFMGIYEEEIVKLLTKRKLDMGRKEIINNFCDEYTQVCKGVEVNYEKSFQKIKKNGKVEGMPITVDIHNANDKNEKEEKDKKNKNKEKKDKKKKNRKVESDL